MELTQKEKIVVEFISEVMKDYGDGFSDVDMDDITENLKMSQSTAKGVIGSLVKKEVLLTLDVNKENTIYYLANFAQDKELP
ncbi:hypothetical protein [Oceanobacillus timonensis]|uniref:hypothetical protein n=1 Tax=Oceanobacillus timonensis TaxID=1926285 RepID=UPI0009BC2FBC|nr:hypothetical protein [Oceanobacillus timonensis]